MSRIIQRVGQWTLTEDVCAVSECQKMNLQLYIVTPFILSPYIWGRRHSLSLYFLKLGINLAGNVLQLSFTIKYNFT